MTTSPRSLTGGARGAIISVLAAAVLFGTAGTARELGPEEASSLSVGAVRIAIGTIVLWMVVLARRSSATDVAQLRGGGRRRRALILLGGAGVAAYTPLFFVAVERVGVALGTVVTIASGPFFTGAIEATVFRHPPSRAWLLGTGVTAGGAALLVGSGGGTGDVDVLGIAAALASGLGYAVYSVTAKVSIEDGLSSTLALAAPFTVGALVVLALATTQSFDWLTSGEGVAMALYLGVFATGFAYVLFGRGLRRLTPSTTVTLVLAEPITAALLAVAVLDETIVAVGWIGIVTVVVGLWLVGRDATAGRSAPSAKAVERTQV